MNSLSDSVLLSDVTVRGARLDCRVRGGVVADLAPRLPALDGEERCEAGGGELLPGLHDHHTHPMAAAAAAKSIDLMGRGLPARAPQEPTSSRWVRVVGCGDDDVTLADLDRLWPDRPVRVQHRSGALLVLNTLAVELLTDELTPEERLSGRVFRGKHRLAAALRGQDPRDLGVDLRQWGRGLAARGVTSVTDATVGLTSSALAEARRHLPQHVVSLGADQDLMPLKVVAPDHRDDAWAEVSNGVRRAREIGRPVAIHAVTMSSLALTLAVLSEVGTVPGDRIEHAAVCDDKTADRLAEFDVVVVTQPTIAARRGRALIEATDPEDRPWLWRMQGLVDRGVRVVLSSDAPYGDSDPWATVRTAAGAVPGENSPWLTDQSLPARTALGSFLTRADDPAGPPRAVAVGEPADLCLLEAPLDEVLARVVRGQAEVPVVLTMVAGQVISRRPSCNDGCA